MVHSDRSPTDARDAAQILRGYKTRIEQLEEKNRGGDETVQLFRSATDTCLVSDSVATSTGTAEGFRFGESTFGFAEFGGDG